MEAVEEPAEPESSRAEAAGRGRGAGSAEPGARSREPGARGAGRRGRAPSRARRPRRVAPRPTPTRPRPRGGPGGRASAAGGCRRAAATRSGGSWPTSSSTGTPTGWTCSRSASPPRYAAGRGPPLPGDALTPPGTPSRAGRAPGPGVAAPGAGGARSPVPRRGAGRRAWRGRLSRVSPPAAGVAALGPGPRTFVTGTREHVTAAAVVGLEFGGWRPGA